MYIRKSLQQNGHIRMLEDLDSKVYNPKEELLL